MLYENPPKFGSRLCEMRCHIVSKLRANDTLVKLLYYSQPDVLTDPNCQVNESIRSLVFDVDQTEARLLYRNYDLAALPEARAYLFLRWTDIESQQGGAAKVPVFSIDILVPDSINLLEDGYSLRHELLFQQLNDTLEGASVGGLGGIRLEAAGALVPEEVKTCFVFTASYRAGELRR